MLTSERVPDSNILELTLDGRFTREDFERVRVLVEEIIDEHGSVRLLEVVRDVGAMEPSAIWEDLKFGPKHLRDFSHVAVVADQKWIEWTTAVMTPLLPMEVKLFPLAELQEARRWLHAAEAGASGGGSRQSR